MVRIWAFLVSIEQYADPTWPVCLGADVDTQSTLTYLTEDMKVPLDHIVRLTGQDATRKDIIMKFKEHLIENPRIERGDTILFHFSGHGSRGWAPYGWAIVESEDVPENERGQLEMIVPWDDGVKDDTGKQTCSIPDRTLGALLDRASDAHGDNIVVVLDCCHSGHGTRDKKKIDLDLDGEELVPRGLDPALVVPLHSDVDSDILQPGNPSQRGGLAANRASRNHVLMAACGRKQEAKGGKKGGLFTKFWLQALRNPDISPRTYGEMLKYVDKQFEAIRRRRPGFEQNPQCEGVERDRLVFEETIMSSKFFQAERRSNLGDRFCRIEAGEVQGIRPGTLFELHELDDKFQSRRTLGSATAREVHATYCIAEHPGGIIFAGNKCAALVLQLPYSLCFALHNAAPNSQAAEESVRLFHASLESADAPDRAVLREVPYGGKVDLVLEVGEDGGMTFRRLDAVLGPLQNMSPTLTAEEVSNANWPSILNAVARFNKYLALENPQHPLAGNVHLGMHLLQSGADDSVEPEFEDEADVLEGENFQSRDLKQEVQFVDGEAIIRDSLVDDYAFVLKSQEQVPLFVYVYYFDPGTYRIMEYYNSFESEKPTLYAKGTLQLGASSERAEPYGFGLPEGAEKDTGFLKVFVLDVKTNLDFLLQEPVVGKDDDGESAVMKNVTRPSRAGKDDAETKGRWDIIVRKVTVVMGDEGDTEEE